MNLVSQLAGLVISMDELSKAKQICSSLYGTQHLRTRLPEVIKLMASNYMPVKRMSHAAFIRHAHKAPSEALLAVNTLLQDSCNSSPVIRCLALNTVIAISSVEGRTDKSNESHTTDGSLGLWQRIVQDAINDPDPMVRRFAVIAIEKLNCDNLISNLQKCLTDPDPLVSIYSLDLYKKHGGEISESILFHFINNIDKYTDEGKIEIMRTVLCYSTASEDQMFDIMSILDAYLDSDNVLTSMAVLDIFLHYSSKVDVDAKKDVYNRLLSASIAHLRSDHQDTVYSMLMWISENVCKKQPNNTDNAQLQTNAGIDETEASNDENERFNIVKYSRYLHLFLPNQTREWYINVMKIELLQHMTNSENCVAVLQACTIMAKSQNQCLRQLLTLLLKLKQESPDQVNDCFESLIKDCNPKVCGVLIEFLPNLLPFDHNLSPKLCQVLAPVWQELSELGLQNFIMVLSLCFQPEQWIAGTISEITSFVCGSHKATIESKCLMLHCVYAQFIKFPSAYAPFLKKLLKSFYDTKDVRLGKQVQHICGGLHSLETQSS